MPDALDGDFARSRAVLIGTSEYRYLEEVPAAMHSLERMRTLLTGPLCGSWPEERVKVVHNRKRLGELPHELLLWMREATDVALFYYVGHGQYDNDDRLCLTLTESSDDPVLRTTTSLTFDAVRQAFKASRASTKIAIVDCCFAGLAAGDRENRLAARTLEAPRSPGFCLLMASGEFSTAWFQPDTECEKPQTYFTKYLADTIERGIPGQPDGLGLGPLFDTVADALVRDGKPEPTSRVADHAARFVLARNRATSEAPESVPKPRSVAAVGSARAQAAGTNADALYDAAYELERDWKSGVQDLARIEDLYRQAAEAGHIDAMARLGSVVEGRTRAKFDENAPTDPYQGDIGAALYWYMRAARLGSGLGAFWLGCLHEDRFGDPGEALKWYGTAARAGIPAGKERLVGLEGRLALGLGPLAGKREFDGRADMGNKRERELEQAHQRWLEDEFEGNGHRAIASCLIDLSEACGGLYGEWGTLAEDEQIILVQHFMTLHPTKGNASAVACEYYETIGAGNLRAFAAKLMQITDLT